MGFDFEKYKAADWQPRTAEVPVPELKDFFPEGVSAVWTVRGISATEKEKASEAVRRNAKALHDLVAAFAYAVDDTQAKITKDIERQTTDMVPGTLVLRYELLMAGSVDPQITDKSDAITLGRNHPDVLERLTEKIHSLTGAGAMPGKQTPCGETTESGQV